MIAPPTIEETRAVVASKASDERRTPAWLLDALRIEFPFTIDVAAREANRQAEHYLGPDHPLIEHRDGLAAPWDTGRLAGCLITVEPAFAWCNPPYSRGQVMRWCAKAAHEVEARRVTTVMLLQADVSTRYWHEHVEPREHRIIKRRLAFDGAPLDAGGRLAPAKFRQRARDLPPIAQALELPMTETKHCPGCKTDKPATPEHFARDRFASSGLASWCRECHREQARAWLQQRKARGLCPDCGEPYDGPFYRCMVCRRSRAAARQARKAAA